MAFPTQEETFSQSVKLTPSEYISHLLFGIQVPVKVCDIDYTQELLTFNMSTSKWKILYVTKRGHSGPECYIAGNLYDRERHSTNHINTFGYVPKDSSAEETRDSTINPFLIHNYFLESYNFKVFSHDGGLSLKMGTIKAAVCWNTT